MEIWKDIKGYEGLYYVSNLGRIKRLYKNKKEKILKMNLNLDGYVIIRPSKNGAQKTKTIHQIVAESFLNHIPCKYEYVVNHIDFDRTNNKLENLEIISHRENTNRKHQKNTSKYTGVCFYKKTNKWKSAISINGKSKHLGYFLNELDAYNVYLKALSEL